MKILITGASGLIGTALRHTFDGKEHQVVAIGRSEPSDEFHIKWDLKDPLPDDEVRLLEGVEAVIHLAGESISALRWTDEKKRAIRDSRVVGTRNLVEALSKLDQKPKVLASASAIGFYGDRGDEIMIETSNAGDTFLAETTKEWETEARRAEDSGIRTVLMRTGIVLSKDGGALATMLTPFKFGVGGVVGSGKQWMSWVSIDDIVAAYSDAIENVNLRGAVNAVSPNPVTNEEFTSALGSVLYRPTILPLPEFAVNLIFGEMGDALLLDSTRVHPKRLLESGFKFKYPDLRAAIEHAIE